MKNTGLFSNKNSSGFSLIEMMVAAGLLGILLIGFLTLMEQTFIGNRTLQANLDAYNTVRDIQLILDNTAACAANVTPAGMSPPARLDTDGQGYNLPQLLRNSSVVAYTVGGTPIGGQAVQLTGLYLRRDELQTSDATSRTYRASLIIELTKTGITYGSQIVRPVKDGLKLLITTDLNDYVTGCATPQSTLAGNIPGPWMPGQPPPADITCTHIFSGTNLNWSLYSAPPPGTVTDQSSDGRRMRTSIVYVLNGSGDSASGDFMFFDNITGLFIGADLNGATNPLGGGSSNSCGAGPGTPAMTLTAITAP